MPAWEDTKACELLRGIVKEGNGSETRLKKGTYGYESGDADRPTHITARFDSLVFVLSPGGAAKVSLDGFRIKPGSRTSRRGRRR